MMARWLRHVKRISPIHIFQREVRRSRKGAAVQGGRGKKIFKGLYQSVHEMGSKILIVLFIISENRIEWLQADYHSDAV